VRTRFEAHVEGGTLQKRGVADRRHGIHLGMAFTATDMIALTDDLTIAHDYGTHHGIGRYVLTAVLR
jgi:hypothetical protein